MLKHRSSLALMAALALGGIAAQPGASRTVTTPPRPRRVALDEAIEDARANEIAEWNAAVEKRKAEKRRLRGA